MSLKEIMCLIKTKDYDEIKTLLTALKSKYKCVNRDSRYDALYQEYLLKKEEQEMPEDWRI